MTITSESELGAFLRARRDSLQPADVGIAFDSARRVSGLRRQEVATLAGISPDYYLRLEQGKDTRPSPQVLIALGRALKLDRDAETYLFRLANQIVPHPAAQSAATPSTSIKRSERTMLDDALDSLAPWGSTPAYVVDRNQDLLAINSLGRYFVPFPVSRGVNFIETVIDGARAEAARATEDTPRHLEFWSEAIAQLTAALRYHADFDDPRLEDIVAKLSPKSRTFREVWASHDARPLREGQASVAIPPFGFIDFHWQTLQMPAGDQFLTSFFGYPDTPAAAAIEFLLARAKLDRQLAGSKGQPTITPADISTRLSN